jgi:hypothetical protein
MVTLVKMVTELLTNEELNALYMVAMLGTNPAYVRGYEKAQALFTESEGTHMHSATLDALAVVWNERIGSE